MEDADNGLLLQPHNLAFGHCLGCRHAPRLSGQTTFAAEFIRTHDCDDGFLPLLGKDSNFDLAVADVKDGIRGISLRAPSLNLHSRWKTLAKIIASLAFYDNFEMTELEFFTRSASRLLSVVNII
jgi:hypothetical protein